MDQRPWTTFAALLPLFLGVAGCASRATEVKEVPPEVRFDSLSFEVFRGASLDARGTLQQARMRRDTSDLAADGLALVFPPAPGRAEARLTAPRAAGNASARWFQLEGGVRGAQGPETVTTERARFDGRDRLVRGDTPVVVRGEGYVLEGPGFTLDPDDRTVRIDGGATLRVGAAAGGPALRAGGAREGR